MGQKKHESVLGWESPFHLGSKLESEYHRMIESKTLQDQVEHTMNFALTANHMTDWIWEAITRKPADTFERTSWISVIGFAPKELKELRKWATSQCPELEYCRQLANASKHMSCQVFSGAPVAEFRTVLRDKNRFTHLLNDLLAENSRLIVVAEDGTEVDLVELFKEKVWPFWGELIWRIYIDDTGEGDM